MVKNKYVYDLETYPNFFSACFKNIDTQEFKEFILFSDMENKGQDINELAKLINFIDTEVKWLIGYNSQEYDDVLLMYIMLTRKRLNASNVKQVNRELKEINNLIIDAPRINGRIQIHNKIRLISKKPKPWQMLDLILQFNPIDRVSLKQLAVNLKWSHIQDLPFKPDYVVKRKDIDTIMDYNRNDVNITEKVMEYLEDEVNSRIAYTKKYKTDIINSSHSQIGKRIICDYYEQRTGIPYAEFKRNRTTYKHLPLSSCISPKVGFKTIEYNKVLEKTRLKIIDPNKELKIAGTNRPKFNDEGRLIKYAKEEKSFELLLRSKYLTHTMALGGLHSNNYAEILSENDEFIYIDLDVASYYPWIIINDGIYPKHMKPVILDIYEKMIVLERMKVKKSDPVLAYKLKIAANAFFGQTKSKHSPFYDPFMTTYICINGELYLFMLMEALELYSPSVIVYSNTDGLTVRVPRSKRSLFYAICERWQRYTGFQLEFVEYSKMIIRDVNNYLMFAKTDDPEKRIKAKGAYVYMKDRKELKDMAKGYSYPIIAKAVQEHFDKGIPVKETITKEGDIYEFMKSVRTSTEKYDIILKKSFTEEHLLKTNRWVVTHGNKEEGRIFKLKLETLKEQKERAAKGKTKPLTEMQTGVFVTLTNDVLSTDVKDYNLDYDFYINQATALINLTKPDDLVNHNRIDYVQSQLFNV